MAGVLRPAGGGVPRMPCVWVPDALLASIAGVSDFCVLVCGVSLRLASRTCLCPWR